MTCIGNERIFLKGYSAETVIATGGLLNHGPYRVCRMPARTDQSIHPDSYPAPGNDRAEAFRHSDSELLPCYVGIAVRTAAAAEACHGMTSPALGRRWREVEAACSALNGDALVERPFPAGDAPFPPLHGSSPQRVSDDSLRFLGPDLTSEMWAARQSLDSWERFLVVPGAFAQPRRSSPPRRPNSQEGPSEKHVWHRQGNSGSPELLFFSRR